MPECKTRHLQLGGDAVAVNGRQYFYTRKKSFSRRHFGIRNFTASAEHFEISRKHKLINIFAKAGPKKEKNIYLESSRKGEFDYVIVWKHSHAVQDIAVASRFLRNRTITSQCPKMVSWPKLVGKRRQKYFWNPGKIASKIISSAGCTATLSPILQTLPYFRRITQGQDPNLPNIN